MDLVQVRKSKVSLLNDLVEKEKKLVSFFLDDELQFKNCEAHDELQTTVKTYDQALEFVFEAIAAMNAADMSSFDEEESKHFVVPRDYAAQLIAMENNYLAQKILLIRNYNISLNVH